MIIYLLKSASCLALLLFFYHLILEKEKMHNFNRFYLLLGVLFSFLAPLITFTTYIQPTVFVTEDFTETPFMVEEIPMIVEETPFDYWQLAIGVYLLISLVFLIRFGFNLFKIIRKIRTHTQIKHLKAVLVLVNDKILPHTFWNYIFINKKEYESGTIEQELFTHELTHVTQKHTFDVLFIELLQAVFWINPLFIFLKRAIQLNHEFLADETVINTHKNTLQYQHLLLNKAAWNNEYYLASNLNYSLTKKRLKMMTTQSSKTKILLKKLAVMPLLAGFVFLFAERVEAQEKQEVIETIVEQPYDTQKDLTESEIYKKYVYRNLTIRSKDKNGKQISKKYSELNEEEKARLIPPPPLKLKKILPTKQQFEALKDSKKYAVWIDGKVVKNEVLNNYKYTDFARYFNSHVYKNARSKRFPQENQASLSTHKYFEAENAIRVAKFQKYLIEEYKIEDIEIIEEKPKKHRLKAKLLNGETVEVIEVFEEKPKKKEYKDSAIIKNISSKQSVSPIQLRLEDVKELYKKINSPLNVYNRKNSYYEEDRNTKPHFVKRTNTQQEQLQKTFAELGSLYFKLSKEEKRKVKKPIHPYKPYIKLKKNNKVFYKLESELTKEDKLLFPPPLAPKNASKEIVEKSQKALEAWKKRTGNDFRTNPNLAALPSGFTFKLNDETNVIITNLNDIKTNNRHLLKLNENEKKQLALRKTIVYASKTVKNKNFNYMIEGKKVSVYDVDSFIKQNPESSIRVTEISKDLLTLDFFTSNKKMTNNELEKVYSKIFSKKNDTNNKSVTDIREKLKDINALKIEYLDSIPNKNDVSKSLMKEYQMLFNKGKKHNIYKVKDVNRMKNIYRSMSINQKESVENVFDIVHSPPPEIDWVFTYKRLAYRVKTVQKNRKANLIRLEEIYNKKMTEKERAKVVAPEKLQVPPPPAKQQASTIDKSTPEYHYTKQTFWIKNKNGKKIAKKYHELSDYYKKKWLLFPPNTYTKKQISNTEFQSLKNNGLYVVKIGGVTVKKDELNKYRATDFVSFSKAEISKLAGLQQKYQYNLYTENYLKTTKTLGVFSYNSALERYQENLKLKLNNKKINENQFKKDFTFLSKMYRTFTKEMVSENNLKLPPPPRKK